MPTRSKKGTPEPLNVKIEKQQQWDNRVKMTSNVGQHQRDAKEN